jgi:hypothetical protein
MGTVVAFCIYCLRVWMINGWYIVTYGMPSPARLSVVLRPHVCTCMHAFVVCIVRVVGSRSRGTRDRTLERMFTALGDVARTGYLHPQPWHRLSESGGRS